MRTLMLAGLAAVVLTSSAAFAADNQFLSPFNPVRPTVSITGVAGVSSGSSAVNIQQNSNFNAAAVGIVSRNSSVNIGQNGLANGASVGTFGRNSNVSVGQFGGRLGNLATIRQVSPIIAGRR